VITAILVLAIISTVFLGVCMFIALSSWAETPFKSGADTFAFLVAQALFTLCIVTIWISYTHCVPNQVQSEAPLTTK